MKPKDILICWMDITLQINEANDNGNNSTTIQQIPNRRVSELHLTWILLYRFIWSRRVGHLIEAKAKDMVANLNELTNVASIKIKNNYS